MEVIHGPFEDFSRVPALEFEVKGRYLFPAEAPLRSRFYLLAAAGSC
jgi:hypothetical protein